MHGDMTRFALACVTCCGLAIPGLGQELERGWTLVREDLELFIDPSAGRLRMEGTLVARLEHDAASPGPILALNARARLLRFDSVSAARAQTELNEKHAEMAQALIARVRFAEPRRRGDEVEISFVCHSEGQGRQFVVDESIALASWVEAWYPILPPQKGVSMGGASKVPGTTTFHLPDGWHAVSNGGLVSSETSGTETVEVWRTERALSRSFAAGPYEVMREKVGGLDVSLYLLSDDLPDPGAHVQSLSAAIEAMEERWGPYPYPSYAIAEVPSDRGAFGASSEQGFIMVKPRYLQLPTGNLPLFAHEASHGWWGNTVGTEGPGGLLCSESLAQYGAVIAAERLWGKGGATEFLRFSRPGYVPDQCARGYFGLWRDGLDKPLSKLVSGGQADHTLSDAKGHWVFHMLRRRVGDETFFATLRALIQEYSGRTMLLDDLRAKFVAAAPEAGLVTFFEQWLDRVGAPVLRHEWRETGDGISVTIEQLQGGEPFELWLDVGIQSDGGALRVERVHLHERKQTLHLAGPSKVGSVRLDPEHELLLWGPEFGASPVPGLEGLEPDPLAEDRSALYAGVFVVEGVGIEVTVVAEGGRLAVAVGSRAPQRLVHMGEHRFRSDDGFIIFDVADGRASSLTFLHDGGGTRRAVRRE